MLKNNTALKTETEIVEWWNAEIIEDEIAGNIILETAVNYYKECM